MTAKPVQPAASAPRASAGRRFANCGAAQVPRRSTAKPEMAMEARWKSRTQARAVGFRITKAGRSVARSAEPRHIPGPAGRPPNKPRAASAAAAGKAGIRYGGSLLREREKKTSTTANQRRKKSPSGSSRRQAFFSDEKKNGTPGRKPARKMRTK